MNNIIKLLYKKWIKKECPHLCLLCKFKKECLKVTWYL